MLSVLIPLSMLSLRSSGDPPGRPMPVWPGPPAPARVLFVSSFTGPHDLGLDRGGLLGFFRRLAFGKQSGQLVRPYGIAVARGGKRICVADAAAGVLHVFDLKSRRYSVVREAGRQQLGSPIGVAFGAGGRLFVSDSERAAIFVYDAALRFLFAFGPAEGLQRPTGIAARGDELFVVDTSANRVVAFRIGDRSVQRLSEFGGRGNGPGQFNYPVDIAISATDRIYVTDSMNFRVQAFDLSGRFLGAVGSPGDSTGHFQRPKGVAVSSDEKLCVVDALSDAVQIFDPDARFLLDFGGPGAGQGEFWLPTGIAIDDSDRIYVVDSSNRRVQIFQYLKETSGEQR